MHLMRIGPPGAEKPVARVDEGTYVDLSDVVDDLDDVTLHIRRGDDELDVTVPIVELMP